MSKEIQMTAGEFREAQDVLGLSIAKMADYIEKSPRYVDKCRADGVFDRWLADGLRTIMRHELGKMTEDCLTKNCKGTRDPQSAWCKPCLLERAEVCK